MPPTATAVPTALDQSTKGILVAGEPFLGLGWYVSTTATVETNVNLFSGLGINQIMPYGLEGTVTHNITRQLSYLDAADAAYF